MIIRLEKLCYQGIDSLDSEGAFEAGKKHPESRSGKTRILRGTLESLRAPVNLEVVRFVTIRGTVTGEIMFVVVRWGYPGVLIGGNTSTRVPLAALFVKDSSAVFVVE